MLKYFQFFIPIFLLIFYIWIFKRMEYSNILPTGQIWLSVFISILISVCSILIAISLFRSDTTFK